MWIKFGSVTPTSQGQRHIHLALQAKLLFVENISFLSCISLFLPFFLSHHHSFLTFSNHLSLTQNKNPLSHPLLLYNYLSSLACSFIHSHKMTRMSPDNIDNVVSVKTKSIMVSELLQGRHSASQLKLLLQTPLGSDDDGPEGPAQAQAHLSQILRSFNQTISLLVPSSGEDGSPAVTSGGESRRRSAPETKDRRGCYKRR